MFVNKTYTDNGTAEEIPEARRYVSVEISPYILLVKKLALNPYYLVAHGFDRGVRNTHYVALIFRISKTGITDHFKASFSLQVFYLKMDKQQGIYFASDFSPVHDHFPVSLGAMFNKKIQSEISGGNFLWSISLIYSFAREYMEL